MQSTAQQSYFNQQILDIEDEENFTFLIGGHFHGSSTNTSGFPAATLLANLSKLNNSEADFLISLGDIFLKAKRDMLNYPEVFFDRLNMPIYNAVGNHDIEDFDYENKIGKTYFYFTIGKHVFIILDTEKDNGDITGNQLKMLEKALNVKADNYFVFAHRPVWAEYHEILKDVFKGNTSSGTNYGKTVYPVLKSAAGNVYMFGGSIGGEAPVSFFYHKQAENITYIATAIRNLPRDGILRAEIKGSDVRFIPMSFTNQNLKPLQEYNLEFWSNNSHNNPFNWRLLPLYIWQALTNWMFWVGVIMSLLGMGTVLIFSRWKRKRSTR